MPSSGVVSGTPWFVLLAGAEVGGVEGRLRQVRGAYGEDNEGKLHLIFDLGGSVIWK